jgi:hypothetical protein
MTLANFAIKKNPFVCFTLELLLLLLGNQSGKNLP